MLQADRPCARRYYLATVRVELALLGPIVIMASVFAGELTRLLLGPAWERAGLLAQLMTCAAWRYVSGHTTGAVLLSQGRTDLRLRWPSTPAWRPWNAARTWARATRSPGGLHLGHGRGPDHP